MRQAPLIVHVQAVHYVSPASHLPSSPAILQVTTGTAEDSVQTVLQLTVPAAIRLMAMLEATLRAQDFL